MLGWIRKFTQEVYAYDEKVVIVAAGYVLDVIYPTLSTISRSYDDDLSTFGHRSTIAMNCDTAMIESDCCTVH